MNKLRRLRSSLIAWTRFHSDRNSKPLSESAFCLPLKTHTVPSFYSRKQIFGKIYTPIIMLFGLFPKSETLLGNNPRYLSLRLRGWIYLLTKRAMHVSVTRGYYQCVTGPGLTPARKGDNSYPLYCPLIALLSPLWITIPPPLGLDQASTAG